MKMDVWDWPVKLCRKVVFSSGHRYWFNHLSEEENRKLFGKWASPYNHGHNYTLFVSVEGKVQHETGMVVNIKRIDDVLKERVVRQFDQKSINDEIPHFAKISSSLENLLLYFRELLSEMPDGARLTGLKLVELPTLWAELNKEKEGWKMTLTRTYEFAASHRLHVPQMSEAENIELFGKCNNAAGHGHNYILEVSVSGEPDPKTGMMVDLGALDSTVNDLVVDRYDHRNLSEDLKEFRGKVATSEVVVQQIWESLDGQVPGTLERVRLLETARNIFEVTRP
ncbi:MAG: 6-carboxytetrahydropterin synthase [Fimbriimonadaceae bacterium]|nr:6-carboxytetrahydropterin synthase [Fimbriimonadaceae bacterium]